MKATIFLPLALSISVSLPTLASAAPAKPNPAPKLVVVMAVDGLPQEQLVRYREQFGKGGFRRLLDGGAWFSDAHQAHGTTVTAVGHAAILTGAYPNQHGIVSNYWIDRATGQQIYCTEDRNHHYIGEETAPDDGTSPARLRVDTLGDQLRYATGNRAKVVAVSGKDRGAILLAGKGGTAYMYMEDSGNFASSTWYMQQHPQWVQRYLAGKPQDRYYGQKWRPLLADSAYAGDAEGPLFDFSYYSESGKPDAGYYKRLKEGPAVDELTLDFARAAIDGEALGANPAGVPDLLGVSLSGHDYVNHRHGPESKMSHDHLQRLDRMLASFFSYLDQRVGADEWMIVLTADHGFANSAEFSQRQRIDAGRIDGKKMLAGLEQHLAATFNGVKPIANAVPPNIYFDDAAIRKAGLKRADIEAAASTWLLAQAGVADVYTRTRFEESGATGTRQDLLMRRGWHRHESGDLVVVPRAYWAFGSGTSGATHGTPYRYDTSVPLIMMGKRWVAPGNYTQYAEVVDIAPTLAALLQVRAPAGAEGRVLTEALRRR
ncbi:alkaline phosphatase family protein [Pseudoduganella albidiflava]|uniref:Alkaline phosphatase family protein n=1 Tax=Pseudoduganella albidiflava TaxID=321983 RepID=A0A411WUW2_9BURK|nr:alkaline phosphatase family protein [Pseudoduganella albidiflava]QBI00546.1 alkaline phosphatase family protein [Pseudoduganella albidiflava]GGY32454.1 alkaline phosphatase family protein [Pseudoduganella albidiflava]